MLEVVKMIEKTKDGYRKGFENNLDYLTGFGDGLREARRMGNRIFKKVMANGATFQK
jgi:hypothetical protein